MRGKFSAFIKRAKLKKDVEQRDDRPVYIYAAPRGHILTLDDRVVSIVIVYPAHKETNPLGGVISESNTDELQVLCAGDDDTADLNGDPVGKWELFKRIV